MDKAALVCIVSIGIILVAPWYKSSYSLVDNTFVRLALVVAILASVRVGTLPALLTFLAVMALLIERNQYVVTHLPHQAAFAEIPSRQEQEQEQEVKAPFAQVHEEEVKAEPRTVEEPVYSDNNPRLPAGPASAQAVAFYTGKGLA